ncbi:MAG: thiamine pyrophosphate-binding protein, partial [Methanoregula sp.]|nr:thiamine pyrophosphate-binding protein [Methanoregula sp.]
MLNLSDFLVSFLVKKGVKDVFLISGGGNMHLINSVGKNKRIKYYCNHHEQATAMAAEAYSRVSNNMGVCFVTTGPGGSNTVTGVLGAWLDSIPMVVISGQVKNNDLADKSLRQLGVQETKIVDIVRPITKYAVMVKKP